MTASHIRYELTVDLRQLAQVAVVVVWHTPPTRVPVSWVLLGPFIALCGELQQARHKLAPITAALESGFHVSGI